jgi:hypothetical protein
MYETHAPMGARFPLKDRLDVSKAAVAAGDTGPAAAFFASTLPLHG